MHKIERYSIEIGPMGLTIKMRQGRQSLICGLISVAVLIASWWFSHHGLGVSAFWTPPDKFLLVWCSFFGLVSLGCIIGYFYRQDATITNHLMVHSQGIGPWRKNFNSPPPRKLRIEVLPMGTSTGRAVFPYQLFFLDEEGKISNFCVEFQLPGSVNLFLNAVQPLLALEVEGNSTVPPQFQGLSL